MVDMIDFCEKLEVFWKATEAFLEVVEQSWDQVSDYEDLLQQAQDYKDAALDAFTKADKAAAVQLPLEGKLRCGKKEDYKEEIFQAEAELKAKTDEVKTAFVLMQRKGLYLKGVFDAMLVKPDALIQAGQTLEAAYKALGDPFAEEQKN